MDITWHGNSCFTLKDSDRRMVISPDREAGKLKGEVVLNNLKEEAAEVEGSEKVFDWPGEYEAKGVPIMAIDIEGTTVFFFQMGKIKVCHLGDLGNILSKEAVNQIDDVDILMINACDDAKLATKEAMEVIEAIDPRVIIPMGSGNMAAILKELGAEAVEAEKKFTIKSAGELPDDSRKVVVLEKA